MKKRSGYKLIYSLLLIPLALVLMVSCSSKKPEPLALNNETKQQWAITVGKVIAEPERAAKVKDLGDELIDVSKEIMHDVDTLREKIAVINKDYDATDKELQTLVEEHTQQRDPKFARYRDIIFAMRSEVNADEWKALHEG